MNESRIRFFNFCPSVCVSPRFLVYPNWVTILVVGPLIPGILRNHLPAWPPSAFTKAGSFTSTDRNTTWYAILWKDWRKAIMPPSTHYLSGLLWVSALMFLDFWTCIFSNARFVKFGKLAWWYQPRFWLLARWRPYRPNIEDLEVLSSTFGVNQNHTEGFGTVHASNGKTPLIWVWDGNFPKRTRRNLPKRLQKVWVDQFDEFISKRLEIKNDKNILVVGWLRLFYTWQPAAIQHHHINPPPKYR